MKLRLYALQIIIVALFLSTLYSCTNTQSKKNKTTVETRLQERTIDDFQEVLKNLPSPTLIPFNIEKTGAAFTSSLVNDIKKRKNYMNTDYTASINMGVYASDLCYLIAYGKKNKAMEYLNSIYEMIKALGDTSMLVEHESSKKKFETYINQQDKTAISDYLTSLYIDAHIKQSKYEQLTMVGLALSGSFIEGIHQVILTLDNFPDSRKNKKILEPLIKIVLNEHKTLKNIIKLLEDLPFDDKIADMISELAILDELYKRDLNEIHEKMKNNTNFILEKDALKDVAYEIKRLRKYIVELK